MQGGDPTVAVGGLILWGGFHTAMKAANRLESCTLCHEMRHTVFQEQKTSVHYKNAPDVHAKTPGCFAGNRCDIMSETGQTGWRLSVFCWKNAKWGPHDDAESD